MRKRLVDLIGKLLGGVRFLGFQNLVEVVVWNSDRDLCLTIRYPEFHGLFPRVASWCELGFKSLYLNPTAHEREFGPSILIGLLDGGFLDAAFS